MEQFRKLTKNKLNQWKIWLYIVFFGVEEFLIIKSHNECMYIIVLTIYASFYDK